MKGISHLIKRPGARHRFIILTLRMLRQEDFKFKVSLGYRVRLCLKKYNETSPRDPFTIWGYHLRTSK